MAKVQTLVGSPVEFGSAFMGLGVKAPNCEMFLNGRWYPVVMTVTFLKGEGHLSKGVMLHGALSVGDVYENTAHYIHAEYFVDDGGLSLERTVFDVLSHFGYRRVQTTPSDFNLKLLNSERAARETGKVVLISGPVLAPPAFAWTTRLESRSLGSLEAPRKGIVEPELETCEGDRGYFSPYGQDEVSTSRLPFIRIFSLDTKSYVYADVDDVSDYEFDETAMTRLHLPGDMLEVLTRVFSTPVEALFGDIIEGKHGGVVILACGPPGVGKTLTAEVYAEHTERPLYVLELGELGTTVDRVEENLQLVFTRVARWNAVLQFDECEIFLTERGEDLERSAIVGIFLRLLDYYRGILFLTTNRAEVLDHAVRSRVMLKLDYPVLDQESRTKVWRTMFESAELALSDGELLDLADTPLNGRQIRNLSRLAKILHPAGQIRIEEMRDLLQYSST
ncbi:MAG: ATP-binding protein [Pirellulaceae bacterium]|jgi:hypothetical protein|nr:ATP-binding protein [Pirellulaceae bacterium]MDP7015811.1 ATP-binding protein [Pirellulaceae bacterium]